MLKGTNAERARQWLYWWYRPLDYRDGVVESKYQLYSNTCTLIECDRMMDGREV